MSCTIYKILEKKYELNIDVGNIGKNVLIGDKLRLSPTFPDL